MKIRPVGAELFHVNRQTDERRDMTNLIVVFSNFVNAFTTHSVLHFKSPDPIFKRLIV